MTLTTGYMTMCLTNIYSWWTTVFSQRPANLSFRRTLL